MENSINLSDISWAKPNGEAVFSRINLQFNNQRTGLVGRNGVGKTTLLKLISGELKPQNGQIISHTKIAKLDQMVSRPKGDTIADLFEVTGALKLLSRAEAGKATAEELERADWALEARMSSSLAQFNLDLASHHLLSQLSGGQHTRAMLAALVFKQPDFILLDEPTNNLDQQGREAVVQMLAHWRGGAIIVSHDRQLLEYVDAIVELTSLGATTYGGNWQIYQQQKATELNAAQHDLNVAQQQVAQIDRKLQQTIERKARKDGTGKRSRAKGGQPKILLNAMRDNAEKTSGGNAQLANRMQTQAQDKAAQAREQIEILQPFSVSLAAAGLANGKQVVQVENLTGGYANQPPIIKDFSFSMVGPERVAISGANGSGKTTLIKLIIGVLKAQSGTINLIEDFALLDQQVSMLDPNLSIVDNFHRLNPNSEQNHARAVLARFLFRADAALKIVGQLSGGEKLRAALACILGSNNPPKLLILDEPTNHLDIDSITTIEAGLNAYDGAILLISHDRIFLENIGITRYIELT